jgi:hypothetical protein
MQYKGIGIELIRNTRANMALRSMLVLLAAPNAVDFYPKIGLAKHDSAWTPARRRATRRFQLTWLICGNFFPPPPVFAIMFF